MLAMTNFIKRRNFFQSVIAVASVATASGLGMPVTAGVPPRAAGRPAALKLSLNAYSFNDPLQKGGMTLDNLLDFCAETGFDAVDLTGYYFPGYPAVPPDEYIFNLKRKAFRLGLDISGTGIKNDFTDPDATKRAAHVALVRQWIDVASKLGAPVIRVFSGVQSPAGYSWDDIATWMIRDFKTCADYGQQHGVIVAMQNHNDFIKTADQAEKIIKAVGSDWFGLVLDIGSYQSGDPFQQIEQTAQYAVNWQIKEDMYEDGKVVKTNLAKVMSIIKASGYRGYLPIETLGAGDPKVKVPVFLKEVRKALG